MRRPCTGNGIKGQIRAERFVPVGSDSQLTLQAAVSEPINSYNIPDQQLDEDNGWPNVEGRIALAWGQPAPVGIGLLTQRPLEVGVSGVTGQLRRTAQPPAAPRRVVSDVWGAAVDWRVNLARLFGTNGDFGFKGEAYTGQALGSYNGAILQTLDAVTWNPIRSRGGWVEGSSTGRQGCTVMPVSGSTRPTPTTSRASPLPISGGRTIALSGAI